MITREADKVHSCGCVTFWNHAARSTVYYRKVCTAHRSYVGRLGILLASS